MKILITGGAGFIGSNFIRYMLRKYPKYDIVCLDNLTYGNTTATIDDVLNNPKLTFIKGDISDRFFIYNFFEKELFDIVINFAGESHVDKSIDSPDLFVKTNIVGTVVLMDASRQYKVKKFHQISTDEVYGALPLDMPDLMFTEETPINPTNPYSASKASADMLVMSYCKTFDFNATISRCCNNYGPYQFTEKLVPLMIAKSLADENLTVHGNGLHIRDWINVYDHCSAIDLIVHKGKSGEVYNVGSNNEISTINIVKMILKLLNKSESLITYVDDRPANDCRYAIDSTKLRNELGWESKYQFEEGFEETVNWYLNNEHWWAKDENK